MKAIGKNVLLEQIFTKKTSLIIVNANDDKPSAEEYDVTTKLVQMGADCPLNELEVGDTIFLNNYATPLRVERVSKTDEKLVNNTIFAYGDIVGKE